MSNRYANLVGTNKIKDEYAKINTGFGLVQNEIDFEIANRGVAEEVIYDVIGTNDLARQTGDNNLAVQVSQANVARLVGDDTITERINNHVNSTTEKHVLSGITNDSSVIGASAKTVVESLQGQISSISAAGANAQIGVYAVSASGTNTLTSTFTGLTYYAGMKMNWSVTADNTGAVTMNVNSIGAKNVYKVVLNVKTALSPRDLRISEIAQVQYDGTDFILLNGVRLEEYSATVVSTSGINTLPATSQGLVDEMLVKGRTTTNLLTDAVAGCESITGWSTYRCTVVADSTNKLEGTNCLQITKDATGAIGYISRDLITLFTQGKYYLLTGSTKNYNATIGMSIGIYFNGGLDTASNTIIATSYNRVGIIIQPSNFVGATQATLSVSINGASTQYGFIDTLQLEEISSADYALGVPALLDKYSWHLGTKSVDKIRVKSVGKNLFNSAVKLATGTAIDIPSGIRTFKNVSFVAGERYNFNLLPNTNYYFKYTFALGGNATGNYSEFKYGNGTLFATHTGSGTSKTQAFTTDSSGVIWIYLGRVGGGDDKLGWGDFTNIQLELGTAATTFEPYQQSQAICPLPLRAVPSIPDTWDAVRGKHVKNVQEYVLQSADFVSLSVVNTNHDVVIITKNTDFLYYNIDVHYAGQIKYLNFTAATATGDDPTNLWKITSNSPTQHRIYVPKGAYADIAAARVALTGTKIIYQLATQIVTYLQPAVLSANSNGTIYQERFVEDYGFYNNGLSLTDTTKLITNLVEVRKWNMIDGSYTIIPSSSITITAGVITAITGAVTGEFYSWDANYDDALSLNGELNYSYAINTVGQVAVNSDKILLLGNKIEDLDDMVVKLEGEVLNTGYSATVVSTNTATPLPSTAQGLMDEMLVKGAISTPIDQYTKLLMTFEGPDASAVFVDATGKTVAPTGNAQIDTAQFKYGTSSALFDGTGDYLTVTDANNDLDIGTQDFCIETWIRFNSVANFQYIMDFIQTGGGDIAPRIDFDRDTLKIKYEVAGSTKITSTTSFAINIWYHLCFTKISGITKMYVNGVQEGASYTDANNYIAVSTILVGAAFGGSLGLNGWLDDLRISVGTGRYTTTFNPQPMRVLTTERMRILSIGKNLFDKNRVTYGYQLNASGTSVLYPGFNHSDYIKINPSTAYTVQGRTSTTMEFYNINKVFISSSLVGQTVTSPAGAEYMRFHWTTATDINLLQLEQGSLASAFTPYQKTQAVCPLPLRAIEGITTDTWEVVTGKHTKNASDLLSLGLASTVWAFNSDAATFKCVLLPVVFSLQDKVVGYKYNGTKMALTGAVTAADQISTNAAGTNLYLTVADADTGWLDAWVGATSFTSMGWAGIIKAYFNGWKMTTANVLCASCVWTGIASGTTQSGTVGYAYAQANIDVGFTPYKVMYQLTNPIVTMLPPTVLSAQALGTVYQENFIEDYAFYGSGAVQIGLITNLIELRKWNLNDGTYVIIPTTSATIANGLITAIAGAATGELYSWDYNYDEGLGLNGELNYRHSTNTAAQVALLRRSVIALDKKLNSLAISSSKKVKSFSYFLYDTSATGNFSGAPIFKAPYKMTILRITMILQGSFAGVDGSNTLTVTFVDPAINTIATKAFTSAPAGIEAFTVNGLYSTLLEGQNLILTFMYAGTVNPCSLSFQIDYIN